MNIHVFSNIPVTCHVYFCSRKQNDTLVFILQYKTVNKNNMDDFRELYRRIEYLRNNGIKMILQNKYKRVAFPLHECYINIAL